MLRLADTEGATGLERADAGAVLREVAGLVEGALRQRQVELSADPIPSDLWVAADPAELRALFSQVVQGLASGMAEGAHLRLAAERRDDAVVVSLITDQPVAAGARRDDYRAAGLGLWVARRLLATHGGSLVAPDDGEGAWRLTLPAA